ncbi:MAG TPA: phage tail protein [Methylophaga sp.]|nr:phage tail protein [Methylophaga sp.]
MSSENIDFDNIPSGIRTPGSYSEIDYSTAQKSIPVNAQSMAIIGQKLAAGTATAEIPLKIFSEDDAIDACGTGSIVHLAVRAALKAFKNIELFIVPLDDAVGVQAEGTITIATDATSSGNLKVWIGNEIVQIAIAEDDTPTIIALALNTAIAAKENLMPVTTGVAAGVVTLTARNDGTLGNNIAVSYKMTNVTGTTVVVVQPTGGSVDPDITNALTAMYPSWFQKIFCTLNDATNLGLLKTHLSDTNGVSSPTEKRRGMGIFGYNGDQTTLETLAGTTINDGRMSVGYHPYTKTTENGHSLDYEIGAAYCAALTAERDPAKPMSEVVLTGIAAAALEDRLSFTQKESLFNNGVTPLVVGSGETVFIARAITTYTTNLTGIPDISKLDVTTITSADFFAFAVETSDQIKFGRQKMDIDAIPAVNTNHINVAFALQKLKILRNVEAHLDEFIGEEDLQNPGQANFILPSPVVPGLYVIASKLRVYL